MTSSMRRGLSGFQSRQENPYTVLGCDQTASWGDVKKAFVARAKQHHPDAAGGNTKSFIRCRHALDQIRVALLPPKDKNRAGFKNDDDWGNEQDFQEWFYDTTGADWMDGCQREEVDELYELASKGLMRGWEVEMACFPKEALKSRPRRFGSGMQDVTSGSCGSPRRRRCR
jgi:hypothetical protein